MAKKPIAKVQLVCRIDSALNTRVRVQAARAGQTLTTFIERALAGAVKGKAARLTSDVSVASRVKPRTKRGESEAPRSH